MKRRLYRSRDNAMLGGVAAGLAEYFDIDVTFVRLIWLLLVFVGGTGIPAYIIAWIVIPREPTARIDPEGRPLPPAERALSEEEAEGVRQLVDEKETARRRRGAGIILIILGAGFMLNQVLPRVFYHSWPLLLVLVGAYLLYDESRRRDS